MAFTEHGDRGQHRGDQESRDEDEDTEMTPWEVGVSPRHDDGDDKAEADEDRGDDREDDVVPAHEARIR